MTARWTALPVRFLTRVGLLVVGALALGRRRRGVEIAYAAATSLLLACLTHLGTVKHPTDTVPGDLGDPLLQAWQLAWGGHAVSTGQNPFDTNVLYPVKNTLAFSDSLLGYVPAGLVGHGQTAALVRYDVVFLLAWALPGLAGYLLGRQLGLGRAGAAVTGLVLELAPWRVSQTGHLQIVSSGGAVLALALLARGHGVTFSGAQPAADRVGRPWTAFWGWVVAAWQVSLGFGVGLQTVYVLGGLTAVLLVRAAVTHRLGSLRRSVWVGDAAGLVVFLGVAGLLARPYLAAVADHPEARRTVADLATFSPPWYGFLTPPGQAGIFSAAFRPVRAGLSFPPEMVFGVSLTAVVLAVAGVALGGRGPRPWSGRRRYALLGLTLALFVLACGTTLGGTRSPYVELLFNHLPGWQGVRTPGRLAVTATLGVALLAGLGAQALGRVAADAAGRTGAGRPEAWVGARWAVGLVAATLVVAEGWCGTGVVAPRPPLAAMRQQAGPTLVLPASYTGYTDLLADQVMLWTTETFTPVVNGASGFTPLTTEWLLAQTTDFPSRRSVAALTAVGVHRVVVDTALAAGTRLERRVALERAEPTLGLTWADLGDSVVATLP